MIILASLTVIFILLILLLFTAKHCMNTESSVKGKGEPTVGALSFYLLKNVRCIGMNVHVAPCETKNRGSV